MIASRKNSSPARWKAHSFARWLVLCVFLVAATHTVEALETGSTLAKLPAPTSTSELAAAERKAADKQHFYHYEGFVSRLFSLSPLLGGEVDIISEVSINSATKKLSFKNNATTAFINVGSTPTKVLDLLDPVIITDNARLIDVYTNETDGYFAPACILYFYEQAAVDRTTVEAIETAVDVLSLAVPGGQGKLIFKVLNYADKLSSVANIASNYNEQANPELANALALTSGILGLVDLGASFSGVKNIATSANKTSDAIQLINKSENALTINHGDRVTALVNKLNQGTDPDVIATMSSVKAREFVEEVLEMERRAAQKAGKTDVVEDLDDALDVVRGVNTAGYLTSEIVNGIKKYFINGVEVGSAKISVSGYIGFDIRIPIELQRQGYATEIFDDAITYFKNENNTINGIEGRWLSSNSYEGGMSTNLSSFIDDYLYNGKTFEEAALNTPTGKIAAKYSFIQVIKGDWDILDLGQPKPAEIYWIELKFKKSQ